MDLDLFLQEKSFKKHAQNINSIREDFIKMDCEKYLWQKSSTEVAAMKRTKDILSKLSDYTAPEVIDNFIKQFNTIDLKQEAPFIYPKKNCKNYFIVNEIINKYAKSDIIMENLFNDDETENHLCTFKISDSFYIALIHKLIYSAYFGENYGGYKIYNEDLLYYAEFSEHNNFILSYPKPNHFVHYQGNNCRRDTDPYKILKARKNIKHIIKNNFFKSEMDLFLVMYKVFFPIFQNWYDTTYNIMQSNILSEINEKINIIYSDLISNNTIDSKWINEKSLFQLVKKKYKGALFQYSPKWLFPQSFDIFIPEQNIAIEYQGIQHYQSIDYFGGNDGFKHRQELDLKKKTLAQHNNIRLIEWRYNESIDIETLNAKMQL